MNVVKKYLDDKAQYDREHPVKMVKILPQNNPNFNLSILKQNVDNIDNLDYLELKNFITRSYKSILSNLFTGEEAQKYIQSFQNIRFLDVFIEVLSDSNTIEIDDTIRVNTLCYHYLILDKNTQNPAIVTRMLKLSSIVNRAHLPGLLGLGLSNQLASMLLIARYSDIDLNVCVKRVDFIIITQPKVIMTEILIQEIMRKLYDVVNTDIYYRIFPYLMMDVLPEYDENDKTSYWITDEIDEVNSILNLAILDILDTLPYKMMKSTIKNYAEGQQIVYRDKPVRFSLRNLSEDYYRIKMVVEQLMDEGDIYIY